VPTYHALNAINRVNLTPCLQSIRVPTLIVFGAHDNTVPLSEGYHAREHIPNSRMILYDLCGHSPMTELPDRFVADVKAFLSA
jgi:pimeloyl-ACP methyl ester carboxylesterase